LSAGFGFGFSSSTGYYSSVYAGSASAAGYASASGYYASPSTGASTAGSAVVSSA
jgi:hypothetical protein